MKMRIRRLGRKYLDLELSVGDNLRARVVERPGRWMPPDDLARIVDARVASGEGLPPGFVGISVMLLFVFGAKGAFFPLWFWLPDTYPTCPVPVAALFSGLLTKVGVYAVARTFPLVFAVGDARDVVTPLLLASAGITMFLGVLGAVSQHSVRRILAVHVISQVGYMVVGVGIGTEMALNGTASHAFAHIIYKGLLFMGAGAVIHMTGRHKLTELGGLYRTMPLTVALYMVGAFAISAFPFFSGFVSKSMVIAAAAGDNRAAVTLMLTLASSGTFLHTGLKLPYYMFFGKDTGLQGKEPPTNMLVAMGLAAAALAATLGLTAPASAQDPAKGGDLVVAMAVTLPSVDPHASTGVATRYVSAHMFEGVVTRGETGDIIPQLAASYEMSDDARTYTFTLRDGATFASGNPVTTEDVLYSFGRVIKLNLTPAFILAQLGWTPENVDQMVTAEGNTVTVTYDGDFSSAFVLNVLASRPASIVDSALVQEHEVDGDMGNAWLNENSAGSGPFTLDRYAPAQMVRMEVQNLRVYERRGLLSPDRTDGGTRLYSEADIEVLHRIRDLLADGLNIAGIARVLELEAEVERLRARLAEADGNAAPGR